MFYWIHEDFRTSKLYFKALSFACETNVRYASHKDEVFFPFIKKLLVFGLKLSFIIINITRDCKSFMFRYRF